MSSLRLVARVTRDALNRVPVLSTRRDDKPDRHRSDESGQLLRKLGEYELAVGMLRAAVSAPEGRSSSHARVCLAATLLDMGDVPDATDVVLELLAEDTEDVPVLMVASRCIKQIAHAQSDDRYVQLLLDRADVMRTKADQLRDRFEARQEQQRYNARDGSNEEPLFLAASIGFPARFELIDTPAHSTRGEAIDAKPARIHRALKPPEQPPRHAPEVHPPGLEIRSTPRLGPEPQFPS